MYPTFVVLCFLSYMYILHLYFTKGTTRLNTCCSIEEVLASPRRHLHRVPQPRHGHLDKNVNIFILSYFCQGHLYNDVIICITGALLVVIYGVSIHSINSTLRFCSEVHRSIQPYYMYSIIAFLLLSCFQAAV